MADSRLSAYDYELPPELVAKVPASPRDSARLMVVDTGKGEIHFDTFRNLGKYLPERSLLVLNETKVLPARATLYKATGGKVVVLFLMNEWNGDQRYITGMVDRGITVEEPLYLSKSKWLIPLSQNASLFTFEANFPLNGLSGALQRRGKTPIPPYLKDTPLSEKKLRLRYQAVFAKDAGSVAAPTASLHFTKRVFEALQAQHIGRTFVTLHVGMGTFAPIRESNFESKTLHEERYAVPKQASEAILRAKEEGRAVVAVGTTAMRTLESGAPKILHGFEAKAKTDLFIYPPYDFKIADALITNFHLPRSSLMCLVDAFLLHKKSPKRIMDIYRLAIVERMRFFSFGDCMLIV